MEPEGVIETMPAGDRMYSPDYLPLRRIAWKDFASGRVLDRLILYERRIENSMMRMLKEFQKQQVKRIIVQREIEQQYDSSAFGVQRAASSDLKKRSQFMPNIMSANLFMAKDYGYYSPAGNGENKANQSQFSARGHGGTFGKVENPFTWADMSSE